MRIRARMITNLVNVDDFDEVAVGMPLEVVFEDRDGVILPQFEPVEKNG